MPTLRLSRQQLAQFLPNHEAIKAFENLFVSVQETIPTNFDDVQTSADTAQIQAAEALAGLATIANSLSLLLSGINSEQQVQDNLAQLLEQQQNQDIFIPPFSLGTMAEQNADKVNIKGGTIANDISSFTGMAKQGSWTPTPTGLTVVGTPTYTGKYTRIGNVVFVTLAFSATVSTASTIGTTYFSGLPYTPVYDAPCGVVLGNTPDRGVGYIWPGSRIYLPTWAANAYGVGVNGFYFTNDPF